MIKVFEMFAGYGGASFALKKAEIEHEVVGFSEIDKYAIQCYEQNHKGKSFGDCTKINPHDIPDFDLLTGGFPCQSFSNAGKGLGELDTRGTLFNEIIRIAEVKQPKWMLLENVKGLTTKKHKATYNKIISELHRIGYYVKTKILNSKCHGIPQNRERVFFICMLANSVGFNGSVFDKIEFPKEEHLEIFLKDILEYEVDEKYYLSEEQMNKLLYGNVSSFRTRNLIKGNVCQTLQSAMGTGGNNIPLIYISSTQKHRTVRTDGISNCLPSAMGMGGGHTPMILKIKNATHKGYLEGHAGDGVNLEHPNSETRRGRIQKDVIGCLQTNDQRGVITPELWIRKLTPKECFRLMGFLDDNINLDGLSNTQRYKLAGNGWDINLVSKIFKQMFSQKE